MSDSKIQIKVGHVEFSGEGNQEWLGNQLDKILAKVPDLLKIELAAPQQGGDGNNPLSNNPKGNSSEKLPTLSTWLKDKSATTVQTRKFLATAAYIQLGGKTRQNTSDVTAALRNAVQGKLNNASDCLNQNVNKGHCEKDKDGFFVTEEGLKDLGISI